MSSGSKSGTAGKGAERAEVASRTGQAKKRGGDGHITSPTSSTPGESIAERKQRRNLTMNIPHERRTNNLIYSISYKYFRLKCSRTRGARKTLAKHNIDCWRPGGRVRIPLSRPRLLELAGWELSVAMFLAISSAASFKHMSCTLAADQCQAFLPRFLTCLQTVRNRFLTSSRRCCALATNSPATKAARSPGT